MLVLWRERSETVPGYVQGLATTFAAARVIAEGIPNVSATDYDVDARYTAVNSWDEFEHNAWVDLTDEHGIWVKW